MDENLKIERITELPDSLMTLVVESEQQGYRFLRRLVNHFQNGENRFCCTGEALFATTYQGALVGIGGVNIQPDSEGMVGRVRHLYVANRYRHLGIGRQIMAVIEQHSQHHFAKLVLFTDTSSAEKFYLSLGYEPVNLPKISHQKWLIPN